ncbi:hypothetical protein Q3O59_09550 [Alkalimonas delamerensis]|uniref:Uncharacterized protein n=1 Tax=Alkalimonas delamerensis TaxID=265981 RepID=A0ABT9GQQ0_9GAMM|nr:hypothetical protein [Alkalimonas delamerensis]MDP4529276.1 hypothetical protein [Alkalimonas delamerensis]
MNEATSHQSQKAQFNKIQSAIDSSDYEKAIQLTIEYYGIDMTDKGETFKVSFDGSYEGGGYIGGGQIFLGREAFSRGVGFLGSTIDHEMVHIRQGWRNKGDFGPLQTRIFEVRAYRHQIENSARFGLSGSDVGMFRSRKLGYCNRISSAVKQEMGLCQ